jgi:hypothetical protein
MIARRAESPAASEMGRRLGAPTAFASTPVIDPLNTNHE